MPCRIPYCHRQAFKDWSFQGFLFAAGLRICRQKVYAAMHASIYMVRKHVTHTHIRK